MTKTDLAIDLFIGLNEGVITADEYTEMMDVQQLSDSVPCSEEQDWEWHYNE
tara:strand:- start:253 stop:408 length:156 start_codon:yes stop_codon:yes gene_type:complete